MSKATGQYLGAELSDGPVGLADNVVYIGCKRNRAKRIIGAESNDLSNALQHACHNCQRETWWNISQFLRRQLK